MTIAIIGMIVAMFCFAYSIVHAKTDRQFILSCTFLTIAWTGLLFMVGYALVVA